jgi:hypothetical protein
VNRLHLPPALEGAGWPGVAGVLVLATAALLSAGLAPRWQGEADQRLQAAQRARPPVARLPVPGRVQAVAPWPAADATPGRSLALLALARHHGVNVVRVREQTDPAGHLQLSTAGRGRYSALRDFVSESLAGDSALLLDRIHLQRPAAGDAELDFELQWTLLQRAAAPASASAGGEP